MWEKIAKYLEAAYNAYVDWDERFYNCPECGEPVYECDWTDEDFCKFGFLCPICEYTEEE